MSGRRPVFYVMLDAPPCFIRRSQRHKRTSNKPRREHPTLQSAKAEALRLTAKTGFRSLVLQVVAVAEVDSAALSAFPHEDRTP